MIPLDEPLDPIDILNSGVDVWLLVAVVGVIVLAAVVTIVLLLKRKSKP